MWYKISNRFHFVSQTVNHMKIVLSQMMSENLLYLLQDISNAFVLSDAESLIQREGLRCSSFRAR